MKQLGCAAAFLLGCAVGVALFAAMFVVVAIYGG